MEELQHGVRHVENDSTRGRPRSEVRDPQLGVDVRAIVEPHTQADPEMRSTRCYANLTAAEVRQELIDHKGYQEEDLPTERTFRSMLNRMNYRLRRIQKSKPLKKTMETDAIFENVEHVRTEARLDPHTLEISIDTKAKVAVGEYSRGGKTRSDSEGKTPKALDHDTGQKKS
jgi:hypothetical protein